jgi:Uma2 family endonuclease
MDTAAKLMTEEEFLALPDDGIERWLVNGELREGNRQTVTVYKPGAKAELFNEDQTLSGEPHLPGFSVPVRRLFE